MKEKRNLIDYRFSETISMVDYYIAIKDETSLEHELLRLLALPPDLIIKSIDVTLISATLGKIDLLKAGGRYEAERARLKKLVEVERKKFNKHNTVVPKFWNGKTFWARARRLDAAWQRMIDGLRSSNAEQRQRFEALFAKIKDKSAWECIEIFEVLEPAAKPLGRKKRTAFDPRDQNALMEMKALVRSGMSVRCAAKKVAAAAGTGQGGTFESRVKFLQRAYAKKMALRTLGQDLLLTYSPTTSPVTHH